MKNTLSILAGLLAFSLAAQAQSLVDELYFDARASWTGGTADGTAFAGEFLNFHAGGHLGERVGWRLRQRLTKPLYDPENPLNATDFLFLDWTVSEKWHLTGGKLPVLIGGYEWDDAPIDVYYWNGFCNQVWQVYALGAQASYSLAEGQTLTFQWCNSPWSRGKRDVYAYNLGWYGGFAPWWKTIWSVNYMDDCERMGIAYLSLGNRFEAGRWALELDAMDRESLRDGQRPLSDWSVVGRLVWALPRWNLFAKGGYDVNASSNVDADGRALDVIVAPGTEYAFCGGGVEFFPRPDIRLHAVLWGDNATRQLGFSLGMTCRLNLIHP